MQSSRMFFSSPPCSEQPYQPLKNVSVETQTEGVNKLTAEDFICPSRERFENNYNKALKFLNRSHQLMNETIEEKFKQCGDLKPDHFSSFYLPDIPNYFSLFHLLLNKSNNERPTKGKPIDNGKHNRDFDSPELEDFNAWLDQAIISTENFAKRVDSDPEECNLLSDGYEHTNDKISVFISPKGEKREPEIKQCSSEVDVEYTYSLREVSSEMELSKCDKNALLYSRLSENIDKTKKNKKLTELIRRQVKVQVANRLRRPTKKRRRFADAPFVQESFPVIDIQPQVNLFEYAKKRSENIEDVYPKHNVQTINFALAEHIKNNTKDVVDPQPSIVPLRLKRSTTNVVNEMFKKVSQENIVGGYNHPDDKNIMANWPVRKPPENVECYKQDVKNNAAKSKAQKTPKTEDTACGNGSDSDSIILDDEEFQKMSKRPSCSTNSPKDSNKEKPRCCESCVATNSKVHRSAWIGRNRKCEEKAKPPTKLHPLQLSDKDLSLLDDKVIKDIGLFTEGGSFRPGIIDVLQEKQRSVNIDNNKNKQFRTKRKVHIEVNFTRSSANLDFSGESSVSSGASALQSIISYCSDLKVDDNPDL